MKKTICLLLALCCTLFLTGCAGRSIEEDKTPVPTLKPAEARFAAPDGDGIVSEDREYRMYFPGRYGLRLVSRSVFLEAANLNDTAEMLIRSMIAFEAIRKPESSAEPGRWTCTAAIRSRSAAAYARST